MISDKELTEILTPHLPEQFRENYLYSVIPAGKLFRPKLVQAIVSDLSLTHEHHKLIAAAIEVHHVYTLVHDDLPAMDDDDIRRGRASSHKKYNEWMAILIGDGLLCASFSILAQINSTHSPEIIRHFGELVGARGLVAGQMLDLMNSRKSFEDIIRIHTLKTARLFRSCFNLPLILENKSDLISEFSQLADCLGILFQLKDDYDDFNSNSVHEKEINPYSQFGQEFVTEYFNEQLSACSSILEKHDLPEITKIYNHYFG